MCSMATISDDVFIRVGDRVRFVRATDDLENYRWSVGEEGTVLSIDGAFIYAQRDWPDGPCEVFLPYHVEVIPGPEPADSSRSSEPSDHQDTSLASEPLLEDQPDRLAELLQAWEEREMIAPLVEELLALAAES